MPFSISVGHIEKLRGENIKEFFTNTFNEQKDISHEQLPRLKKRLTKADI